jgi:hypothetical protein
MGDPYFLWLRLLRADGVSSVRNSAANSEREFGDDQIFFRSGGIENESKSVPDASSLRENGLGDHLSAIAQNRRYSVFERNKREWK